MGLISVLLQESITSKRSDIRIDVAVKIQSFIYNNAKYVDIGSTIYLVERTYTVGQFIELYLRKTKIKIGDIIGYPG